MRDPSLPRMERGLPRTTLENCKLLLLAIVGQALQTDDDWLLTDFAEGYLKLLGLSDAQVLAVRLAWCRNQFGPKDLWQSVYARDRWPDKDPRQSEASWQSWGALAR